MRLLLALLLALSSLPALSAQRFSFAGLTWGDSPKVVDQKLRAAGHSGLAPDPMFDTIKDADESVQQFSGQVANHPFKADATFASDKLIEVRLRWNLAPPNERADDDVRNLLEIKYGRSSERGTPAINYERFWKGASGDELALGSSSRSTWDGYGSTYLTYASPELLQRAARNGVIAAAQKRKAAAAAKAASQAKAAGL